MAKIVDIVPITGPVGTTVTIYGEGFGLTPGDLNFDSAQATVTHWDDNKIVCTVPSGAVTGNISVVTSTQTMNFTVT